MSQYRSTELDDHEPIPLLIHVFFDGYSEAEINQKWRAFESFSRDLPIKLVSGSHGKKTEFREDYAVTIRLSSADYLLQIENWEDEEAYSRFNDEEEIYQMYSRRIRYIVNRIIMILYSIIIQKNLILMI